ncbi:MAG TPA: penicillin-binding transpeptidase domain-containing protein [Acidimicrobiales bacterium]|nr:penicillin-binding transpeptidase domain-containing protein [Acidimicrobiales bacterium]
MNRQIRRLAVALSLCFVALFAQLNRVQVFQAAALNENPDNTRTILRDYSQPRGTISTADGLVVARSVEVDTPLLRERRYPEGELFAQITGFFSLHFGTEGVERTFNDELAGQTAEQEFGSLADLFVERERTGDVVLSVRADVQRAARDALGERPGSVVALDPRTGEVLALWSWPSYDPNRVSDPDLEAASEVRALYLLDERDPLLGRTYQERYFPGSTFKIVTAAAGLESGIVTATDPTYPVRNAYTPPLTTRPIRQAGGSACGGALVEIIRVSCNPAFAEMGAEDLGPGVMIEGSEAFGFNDTPPFDLPSPAASVFPTDFGVALDPPGSDEPGTIFENTPALAQAAIGLNDVAATPLHMALIAAAVANGGDVPAPRVVNEVRDADGELLRAPGNEVWLDALNPGSAAILRTAMLETVARGTAQRLAIPGFEVGGKTGTAQFSTDPPLAHAWIIGFAGPPGGAAEVAVAVVVLAQDGVTEQSGGRVAAPVARAVLEAALRPLTPVAPTTVAPSDPAAPTTTAP